MTDATALIQRLHALGFTNHESRCLLALMESHPATAYDIAKRAGVPRANAYSALDSLSRKNAVQPVSETPVRFVPVEPEELFGRIAEDTSRQCTALARDLSLLKQPADSDHVWSIPNIEQVHSKIETMIEAAAAHVWIKGNVHAIEPHFEALKDAAARDVKVVIILFGTPADVVRYREAMSGKIFLHEGSGTPVGHSNHLFCLAVDNREGLTASLREGGYGIHTRNRPVVELIDNMIRHEVYLAEIFDVFGKEIEEKFGPMLLLLREQYLPADFVTALKTRLAPAPADPKRKRANQ